MTLTAGYDLVAEVSPAALGRLLLTQLPMAGDPVMTPFELHLSLPGPTTGSVHLVVDEVSVEIEPDDAVTVRFRFTRGSAIIMADQSFVPICPVTGEIAATTPVVLIPVGRPDQQAPALDLPAARTRVNFSGPSADGLVSLAPYASMAAEQYLRGLGQQAFPMAFAVVPGTDGSLSPLQFEHLEVHTIWHPDPARRALGLFGILLLAHHDNGDHSAKTESAIATDNDVSLSISPSAFKTLVFCPGTAAAFGVSVTDLPASCGLTSELRTDDVLITGIEASPVDGHVDVDVRVRKDGFCYAAHGTCHGEVTLAVTESGDVTSAVSMDQPEVDVDVPWYCYLAVGVVAGPFGLLILAVLDAVADGVADSMAAEVARGFASAFRSLGTEVPGQTGFTYEAVAVSAEGFTLQGHVVVAPPTAAFESAVLIGSVATSARQELSRGTYASRFCTSDDVPYVEQAQQQSGVFSVVTGLLVPPLAVRWELRSEGVIVPLENGSVAKLPVQARFAVPLPSGSPPVSLDAHMTYVITDTATGSEVRLHNRAQDGNYAFTIAASITDCTGHYQQASQLVTFEGNHADLGSIFTENQAACVRDRIDRLRWRFDQLVDSWRVPVPPWVPINNPQPENLAGLLRGLAALPTNRLADELVNQVHLLHGDSVLRSVASQLARKTGIRRDSRVRG